MDPIGSFLSAVLQVAIALAVPFLFYLATRRSWDGFTDDVGLKRPSGRPAWIALALGGTAVGFGASDEMLGLLSQEGTVSGQFVGQGLSPGVLVVLLSAALIKTSLSEEILFRGFIAKGIIAKLGFRWGNLVQAVLFGAIHWPLYFMLTEDLQTPTVFVFIAVFPTVLGWLCGYLNERVGNGSIVPGWILHGVVNTISYSLPMVMAP